MERTFSAAVKRNPGRPKRSSAVTQVIATTVDGSRKRGRPKKDDVTAAATTVAPTAKRGRESNTRVVAQPSRKSIRGKKTGNASTVTEPAAVKRNPGRLMRSSVVSQVAATTVDGSRKRGRPKKDDSATVVATVPPAAKCGRKSNTGVVAKKPVGRPRKVTSVAAKPTTGRHEAANARALKNKTALLQEKVKEAGGKLKIAIKAIKEMQALVNGM